MGHFKASLLFGQELSGFLIEMNGLTQSPYDHCVVNKTVNASQCSVVWYVDDIKLLMAGILEELN